MSFRDSELGVAGVDGSEHFSQDGDVCRIGSGGRIVFSLEGTDEISEYGMLLDLAWEEARIWLTQVGYPLPHRGEDFRYLVSPDRLTALSGLAVSPGKDKDVGDFAFSIRDVNEGAAFPELLAELRPDSKDLVLGSSGLGDCGSAGDLERSADISRNCSRSAGGAAARVCPVDRPG